MTARTFTNRFNRGEIDSLALARPDVERVKNSGALMNNFLPIRLGGMQYRPGFGYLGPTLAEPRFLPFIAGTNDTALLELSIDGSIGTLRVWLDDAPIVRVATGASVTNGDFFSDLSGWANTSTGGGSAVWSGATTRAAAIMGDGNNYGGLRQKIVVSSPGVEHALRFKVLRYSISLLIGTAPGLGNLFDGSLLPGMHSLAIIPAGNFYIEFRTTNPYTTLIDSVSIEGAGAMTLPLDIDGTLLTLPDLKTIRFVQSADVVFIAGGTGIRQQRIERRGRRSWSVTRFVGVDGPFETINITPITLTPSGVSGFITLTASAPLFKTLHVGALFKLITTGQSAAVTAAADNLFSSSIRVFGAGAVRQFAINITDVFDATVTLQRSLDDTNWQDYATFAAPVSTTSLDGLDNQTVYYRIGVKTGDYTSGTVTAALTYGNGSTSGLVRIDDYTTSTFVGASVLSRLGSTGATRDWYEGSWSDLRGYPSAVAIFESRLCWAGKARLWASVSDTYDSYDAGIEGGSAAIQRTIGFGPVDNIEWLFAAGRLMMGLASAEIIAGSSSFNDALTNTNIRIKKNSRQGCASTDISEGDSRVYFVQRGGRKLFEIDCSSETDVYPITDLNVVTPEFNESSIIRTAVTRQPDTRVWCVTAAGQLAVFLHEPAEDVRGWARAGAAVGTFTDVVTLPGTVEDVVYVVIKRLSAYSLHRLARFDEARGGDTSKHLDSAIYYTLPGTTLTGLAHLEGLSVRVWADGQDRGAYTVTGGQITVGAAWSSVVVGLAHTADYTSNKISDYVDGWVINQNKRIVSMGGVLAYLWPSTFTYGSDTDHLDPMPRMEDGVAQSLTTTVRAYDELPFEFNGTYDSDSRYHLRATGPVTVLAVTIEVDDPN